MTMAVGQYFVLLTSWRRQAAAYTSPFGAPESRVSPRDELDIDFSAAVRAEAVERRGPWVQVLTRVRGRVVWITVAGRGERGWRPAPDPAHSAPIADGLHPRSAASVALDAWLRAFPLRHLTREEGLLSDALRRVAAEWPRGRIPLSEARRDPAVNEAAETLLGRSAVEVWLPIWIERRLDDVWIEGTADDPTEVLAILTDSGPAYAPRPRRWGFPPVPKAMTAAPRAQGSRLPLNAGESARSARASTHDV